MVLAFLVGTTTVTSAVPCAPQAVTSAEWIAIQASISLLLDQGAGSIYLPVVLRH
jgi:hypothetical protein